MNAKKQRWILYLITITIFTTIAVQVYWNYNNYQQNKQRVLNEIQLSLDNSLETYYTNVSKQNFFTIVEPKNPTEAEKLEKNKVLKSIFVSSGIKKNVNNLPQKGAIRITSIALNKSEMNFQVDNLHSQDSSTKNRPLFTQISKDGKSGIHFSSQENITRVQVFKGKKSADSLKLIKGLQTMMIAIHNDSINYTEVDSILTQELQKKGIGSQFYMRHLKKDSLLFTSKTANSTKEFLMIEAKSTFIKPNENFVLHYSNPTKEALKRSLSGILLSLLLAITIIASLFYLLHIINQQKELAVIKNDLISNITHEFKTPITTVSTALEAIDTFNVIDDKEKTKKYLSISTVQLKKLHLMVEKLLETASLDSENLLLKKESTNLVDLIDRITKKHQLIASEKRISFESNIETLHFDIDIFHFENSISNLIDNAIKYGGNNIQVSVKSVKNHIEISIKDNGKGIEKNQQEKIFEQFYRIPKGNTHDVKGFGIGLYYSKKIIEKHRGSIDVTSNKNNTIFKITLPSS